MERTSKSLPWLGSIDHVASSDSPGQGACRSVTSAVSVAVCPAGIVKVTSSGIGPIRKASWNFIHCPSQTRSPGPVWAPGGGVATPVRTICAGGLTLTVSCSLVAPAVSASVCLTVAGSLAVEPTRAEETVTDGLA